MAHFKTAHFKNGAFQKRHISKTAHFKTAHFKNGVSAAPKGKLTESVCQLSVAMRAFTHQLPVCVKRRHSPNPAAAADINELFKKAHGASLCMLNPATTKGQVSYY